MPIDYSTYPTNWRQFSDHIRFVRAATRCECLGQCGLHQPNPSTRRCTETHHQPATYAHGIIRLTVAHLCQCHPPCADPSHVIAACQRCHLRIDRQLHAANRKRNQSRAKEAPKMMTKNQAIGLLTSLAAIAEGYTTTTTIPWKQRNPGDMTLSRVGKPTPNGKVTYDLHSQGWQDLEAQFERIFSGKDPLYPSVMTWEELEARYTGSPLPTFWGTFFANHLKVYLSDPIRDWWRANVNEANMADPLP